MVVKKKKHSQFCEGHVLCPKTGKEECGKVVVWRVSIVKLADGKTEQVEEPAAVYCFGCGGIHECRMEAE